jgi:hypothetical protein
MHLSSLYSTEKYNRKRICLMFDEDTRQLSRGGILDRSAQWKVRTISVKCVRIHVEGAREDVL